MNLGKIVPVVTLDDPSRSVAAARALAEGGMSSAEITLRTDNALHSIDRIRSSDVDLLVGAGTVITLDDAKNAYSAGASFIVSPGLSPAVVDWCLAHSIPVFPGVVTPGEITHAIEFGLTQLKFFPAELNGGAAALKAYAAPFRKVSFMPTGGVNLNNLRDYLSLPNVFACGGTWLCPADAVALGDYNRITTLCREALAVANTL